ncbi:hypothetical protein [Hallerella succinigenes]|uniref:Carbamoylphosphate synthase large subunit n=1 Tax=Hallerella succinigenes TaxID=1896222 RepID=A0A2M9A663_9BACT|nr:hypothetical protein [Hallerella succinigenes]PJJ41138.1 carbamoylphosphate synthase large subunit [Hallerella succinigenes]
MKTDEKQAIVIFSGFNMRAVIAFLRTLEKNHLDFYIIAISQNDPIFKSKYSSNVVSIREKISLDLADISKSLSKVRNITHADELFIAPSTEALNRFLQKNRPYFEELGCIIPLVPNDVYNIISDKKAFRDLCDANGILIPKEVDFDKTNIPFVIKPKYYETTEILSAPIIVDSEDVFNSIVFNGYDYFCEEFVKGNSYYILYYFSKNQKIYKLFQENIAQQPFGKSVIAAEISSASLDDSKFIAMFKKLNFQGLVMVEVRKKNNQLFMIEANPRFWGPSQLFVDYGQNFFDYFLEDYGFAVEHSSSINKNARYYWSGGLSYNTIWHNKSSFLPETFEPYDIYKRDDTREIYKQELIDRLKSSYNAISKHSQYQILPRSLSRCFAQETLNTKSRAEQQRFDYITQKVSLKGKSLIDIGANTGFFSFNAIEAGAKHVTSYEGNTAHAEFMSAATKLLELCSQMEVKNEYYNFNDTRKYDICFLLNVIHHLGDDYGDKSLSIEKAKEFMIQQLNKMSSICQTIVFQLGFNWKGNRETCLFDNGTKQEMIDFIKNGTKGFWDIKHIGVAEKQDKSIIYKDLSPQNIQRTDEMGEFLNRPIFIMESALFESKC